MKLNRWVLSWDLKDSSDWLFLISGGSRFHASGADMAKRRPKSVAVETTTMLPHVDDRSPLWHWQMTQVGRSLQDTVVQDHVKTCRLANKACTVSVVELAASEFDHAAHDWCDRTCSVHRWCKITKFVVDKDVVDVVIVVSFVWQSV